MIGQRLKAAGFGRVRRFWWMRGVDDQWAVTMTKDRWGGPSFQMNVQADLQAVRRSERPIAYPIDWPVFDLPPLREKFGDMRAPWVAAVLQLDNGLGDEKRLAGLDELIELLAGYVVTHLTVESLREAYQAGQIRPGFVHRQARAFFEADDGEWRPDWVDR